MMLWLVASKPGLEKCDESFFRQRDVLTRVLAGVIAEGGSKLLHFIGSKE